jgi:glycosyltransferase involved in cell wall biosynthesis
VDAALERELGRLCTEQPETRHVHVPDADGLGGVLQAGLERCSAPLVARMDADDVADPDRFANQRAVFANEPVHIVGSHLAEFTSDPDSPDRIRRVPTTHEAIADTMAWRNPMNHPTTMFEREAVLAVGGYRHVPMMEDWDLWARCLASGLRFRNLDQALVRAQTDRLAARRGGLAYARAELAMARELRALGLATPRDTVTHLCLRIPPRLLPTGIRAHLYRLVAR